MVQPSTTGRRPRTGGATRAPLVAGVIVLVGLAAWALGGAGGSTNEPEIPSTLASTFDPAAEEAVPDLPLVERIITTESFWRSVGAGDTAGALSFLDPGGGAALANYASFVTAFEAEFAVTNCTPIASNAVRCTLEATNEDLISLYYRRTGQTVYQTTASVTYNEDGIDYLDLPGIIGSASVRLLQHARAEGSFPPACDRGNYPVEELPPFSTSMAQTGTCGRALAGYLTQAIEAT